MAVVTISREFGSEGNYIGKKIAEVLNYRYIFKQEINEIFAHHDQSLLDSIYYGETNNSFWPPGSSFEQIKTEAMESLRHIIQGVASHDHVVIIGRCGCAILKNFTDVVNVRIQAPLSLRTARIMREQTIAPRDAENLVREEDRKRQTLFKDFFNFHCDQSCVFDMVIDTGKILPDWAALSIVEVVKHLEKQTVYKEPHTQTIRIEPALHTAISEMFKAWLPT